MPGPRPVAVVTESERTGVVPEVVEVRHAASGLVLVVSGHGSGPGSVASPVRLIAIPEVRLGAVRVRVVAGREHCAAHAIEQLPRRGRRTGTTDADITGAD